MRRSLASHYRIKTAHHLLNIVALKREMDTYSVDGLLKAASTGHSKEACLRYAGLQAAMLIEKRAFDDYAAMFKQGAAGGPAQPPRKPTQMSGFGTPNPIQLKPTASPSGGGGGYTGGNYMINTQATKPSTAPSNLDASMMDGLLAHSKANNVQAPGLSVLSPASPPPAMNAARTGSLRQAPAPLTAGVIPKPAGYSKPVPNQFSMTPGQQDARIAKNQVEDASAQQSKKLNAQKPTYTEDPVEAAYSKQLNEGAAASAASKQQSDEAAYMKSIEPTAPTYSVSGAAGATGAAGQQSAAPAQAPQSSGRRRFFNGQGIGQGLRNRFN